MVLGNDFVNTADGEKKRNKTPKSFSRNSLGRVALVFLMAFSLLLTGCKTLPDNIDEVTNPTEAKPTQSPSIKAEPLSKQFTLAYSKSDSLNPYGMASQINSRLSSLIYDGIVRLDDNLNATLLLADSIEKGDRQFVVKLKSTAKFSDGSKVAADDIVSSFNLAKASDYYKLLLENVTGVSKSDENTLVFSVSGFEVNELAVFTFPIVKTEGSTVVGTGRYKVTGGDKPQLEINTNSGFDAKLKTIGLEDVSDGDAVFSALSTGLISYTFDDLSSGDIKHIGVPSANVDINYLVFLGVNSNRSALDKSKVRNAIAISIARETLAQNAFAGRAVAAETPFHPSWIGSEKLAGYGGNENIAVAVAQLKEEGYNSESASAAALTLELIVPEESEFKRAAAEAIKLQLLKAGIAIDIKLLGFTSYQEKLSSGEFDLYIGEVKIPPSLTLSPFLSNGGEASFGMAYSSDSFTSYQKLLSGETTKEAFADVFLKDSPFIPLVFRQGHSYFTGYTSGVVSSSFDIYKGIEDWQFTFEA